MKKLALMAVMMFWPMLHLTCVNAALPNKDAVLQWGYANKATSVDDPMRLVVTVKDPANDNKTIERDVAVTDIPQYVAPTQNVGETNRAYGLRIIAAQEAHSKLKADKIAQAINGVLGAGRATAAQSNVLSATPASARFWNFLVPGDANFTPIKNGQVTVTGAYKVVYGPSAALQKARNDDIKAAKDFNKLPENKNNQIPVPKPLTNNHTGEVGDGLRIKNGDGVPPPPSSGSKASIGSMGYELEREFPGEFSQFGFPMVATGIDAYGNSSLFQFGILDTYVATLRPFAGETDEELYLALEALLFANGLPSTYDPLTRTLLLDGTFGEAATLYWANNDTGFSEFLTVSFGANSIPEPGTAFLLLAGLAAVGGLSARRKLSGRLVLPTRQPTIAAK